MHQTGLFVQFSHAEQEESDSEPAVLAAMEQSPEDAGYSPLNTTTEEGESLSQLFEYTLPDWVTDNDRHPIQDEAGASVHRT
jgi:hypothetical protein